MRIDYSTQDVEKYFAHISTPFVYGTRHIQLALSSVILQPLASRVGHFILGLLQMIPVVGALTALFDMLANSLNKNTIYIKSDDAWERGRQFGFKLRKQTQALYQLILGKLDRNAEFIAQRERFQQNIPYGILLEMHGLAVGARVTYEDVVDMHVFLDIAVGKYGCSAIATRIEKGQVQRVVAANHFRANPSPPLHSIVRYNALLNSNIDGSVASYKRALRRVNLKDTVQSIVFDIDKRRINLSTGGEFAARNNWNAFTLPSAASSGSGVSTMLARNLDWPWGFLGSETVVVFTDQGAGLPAYATVTFPGYLGVLSGMNSHGVALACCQSGFSKQNGIPLTLLFREMLATATSKTAALQYLESQRPASSMNLTIAGPDGCSAIEIDPARKVTGYAQIVSSNS